jgi:hypothetical protein
MLAASLGGVVGAPGDTCLPWATGVWGEQPIRNRVDDHGPPHSARRSLQIIEFMPRQQLVLIIVAPLRWPDRGCRGYLDVQLLPQDHLPFVAHSIIVMIMAKVTLDLALLGRCGGGLVTLVGFELPSYYLRAPASAMSSLARFYSRPTMISWPAL